MQNAIPYLGKDNARATNMNVGHHIVMELMKPYLGRGHNVTTDNYFTSLPLAKELKKKNTSLLGTCRWNRRDLPQEILSIQAGLSRYESQLFEEENRVATLTLYKSKPNKAVLLLSSQHGSCSVDESHKKRLPETVVAYNHTKHGVDVCDQMVRLYTSKAQSRRWPMHVFYNILDFAGINAWILYKEVTKESIQRSAFLLSLGEQLCERFSRRKDTFPGNGGDVQMPETRRQCQISSHKNMTKQTCSTCQRFCCGTCVASKTTVVVCCKCFRK